MIKIDELEDSLDKKAEDEYEKLLVDFEEAVKNAKGASIDIAFYYWRGEFRMNRKSYEGYSELSLLRLVSVLEHEGWPVKRRSWLEKLVNKYSPNARSKVIPGAELKRRAREKYRRRGGADQLTTYCFDNYFMKTIFCSMLGLAGFLLVLSNC